MGRLLGRILPHSRAWYVNSQRNYLSPEMKSSNRKVLARVKCLSARERALPAGRLGKMAIRVSFALETGSLFDFGVTVWDKNDRSPTTKMLLQASEE
jgi:hypothetical protein